MQNELKPIAREVIDAHGKTFRERVWNTMGTDDLTSSAVSQAIQSNPSSFSRMLRGMQSATEREIIGLALALGCTSDWLLGLSDSDRETVRETGQQMLWDAFQKASGEKQEIIQQILGIALPTESGKD